MDKPYAIFDMDGTLVDSMGYWKCLTKEFLKVKGISQIPADLLEKIRAMTMTESAALLVQEFYLVKEKPFFSGGNSLSALEGGFDFDKIKQRGSQISVLPYTIEEVVFELNAMMEIHYRDDILLKSGVKRYLDSLYQNGVKMCVASATAEYLMKACLERLDVLKYFHFLLSCETVGAGKHKPDIYFEAVKRMGSFPNTTAVYEDALYAVKTAKKAGFYVVGVYDESTEKDWEKIAEIADETIYNF